MNLDSLQPRQNPHKKQLILAAILIHEYLKYLPLIYSNPNLIPMNIIDKQFKSVNISPYQSTMSSWSHSCSTSDSDNVFYTPSPPSSSTLSTPSTSSGSSSTPSRSPTASLSHSAATPLPSRSSTPPPSHPPSPAVSPLSLIHI